MVTTSHERDESGEALCCSLGEEIELAENSCAVVHVVFSTTLQEDV